LAELQTRMAAMKETRARDLARVEEERKQADGKANKLEQELTRLRAERIEERRKAEASERLRKAQEEELRKLEREKCGVPP
jgi:hypothetical protein